MLTRKFPGAVLAVLIGTAAGGQPAPATAGAAEQAAQACSGRKFETVIRFTAADGKGRQSRVKLCGTPGQSDAEWAKTLRDGAQKARGNAAWPPATRQQVAAAIETELAKVETAASKPNSSVLMAGPPLPAPRAALPARVAAPEYSTLPPFPPPPVAPARAAALSAAEGAAVAAAAAPLVTLARPKLEISCFSPGDIGASGPCFAFERETMITVRAGEPLQNVALRFARGSNVQADHPLPALARGRSTRFALPRSVCAGVAGGTLTIRIIRAPAGQPAAQQVVGTEGPYNLRC